VAVIYQAESPESRDPDVRPSYKGETMRYGRQEVRTAYHEAGHALIAMHSVHLSGVGIERRIKRDGHVVTQKKGWLQPVRGSMVSLDENVLIELGGPIAERMCPVGVGRDYRTASMADMNKIDTALKELLTDSERDEYLNDCNHKVEGMLKHHWPEVKALAQALLKQKRLTGRQAERIVGELLEKDSGGDSGTRHQRKEAKSMAKTLPLHGKPEILTPDELAELLRVSRSTINRLIASQSLPFIRIGNRVVRFKRQAVTKWFREQNTKKKGR
jgi:excisionase family DNA binding protein